MLFRGHTLPIKNINYIKYPLLVAALFTLCVAIGAKGKRQRAVARKIDTRVYLQHAGEAAMRLFASTSPSYLILQSLDRANEILDSYFPSHLQYLP